MKGKLIIISAPSGAGKTTIVKHLISSGLNLEFSVSACSRKKRPNEKHGIDYYFLSAEQFREKIENDEFLEWEEVYKDHFYGTLKSEVERIINEGKNVLIEADIAGGLNIKKLYQENALTIFIQPPSLKSLKDRLEKRGTETEDNLQRRIKKAEEELKHAGSFDQIIINDEIVKAVNQTIQTVQTFIS